MKHKFIFIECDVCLRTGEVAGLIGASRHCDKKFISPADMQAFSVFDATFNSLANKPFAVLGMNQVEREMWRTAAFKALDDMSAHRYWNFYFWSGQKPE